MPIQKAGQQQPRMELDSVWHVLSKVRLGALTRPDLGNHDSSAAASPCRPLRRCCGGSNSCPNWLLVPLVRTLIWCPPMQTRSSGSARLTPRPSTILPCYPPCPIRRYLAHRVCLRHDQYSGRSLSAANTPAAARMLWIVAAKILQHRIKPSWCLLFPR